SPEFRVEFEGATFQFASAAHRDAFVANPSKYAPRYGGYCAYGMAKGYKAKVDPEAFSVVHGTLYLNYSDAIRTRWLSDVPGYIQQADANWPEVQAQTTVRD
ncbi:MAG: YHS domain protein, partial [Nitrospira sp.]|nr:YHS domain protein [Nitrospira sp.]